jgi:hypothetical protein
MCREYDKDAVKKGPGGGLEMSKLVLLSKQASTTRKTDAEEKIYESGVRQNGSSNPCFVEEAIADVHEDVNAVPGSELRQHRPLPDRSRVCPKTAPVASAIVSLD